MSTPNAIYPAMCSVSGEDTLEALQNEVSLMDGSGDFTDGGEPTEISMDNTRRASFAATAVLAYAKRTRSDGNEIATTISDMIGDLHHLCDALGVDIDLAFNMGHQHYRAELRGIL